MQAWDCIQNALEWIEKNLSEKIDIAELAAVAQLDFRATPAPKAPAVPKPTAQKPAAVAQAPAAPPATAATPVAPEPEPEAPKHRSRGRAHPTVPGWEDVLLGVRSGSER